ncbi:MAG TPA: SIS domain-containing protein [Smithella sp.]|nr:SIS domain-containing protein [Smithella sp.]
MKTLIKKIRKAGTFLKSCRIFIGKNPRELHAPCLVIFPVSRTCLHCGFAGLMTVQSGNRTSSTKYDEHPVSLWGKIEKAGLKDILKGNIPVRQYLHGLKTLQAMENAVARLKEERIQESIFFREEARERLAALAKKMKATLEKEEQMLEDHAAEFSSRDLEDINSRLVLLKDLQWALEKDILNNFSRIMALAAVRKAGDLRPAAFKKYRKIVLLLNALNRLEVRGRDSAGLQITFTLKSEKDLETIIFEIQKANLYEEYLRRLREGDALNGSICAAEDGAHPGKPSLVFSFTYKTFSVVGELGRNARELENAIKQDDIFRIFAGKSTRCETAFMHTRWASVGSITEENCHPVNNYRPNKKASPYPLYAASRANISVILNGDIDNYGALRESLNLDREPINPLVTTDTKIIPLQIEKYLQEGHLLKEAFRLAVNRFEGSHAIAMTCDLEPGKFFLALKGSGQSIYVGVSEDQYMFSSEVYGLVEVTSRFLKMNGEASGTGRQSSAGQIFILDHHSQGGLAGIEAFYYDGTEIFLNENLLQKAEITTRDIDRGDHPHFFLKEISESALSIRKTLRGKYRMEADPHGSPKVFFNLGENIFPAAIKKALQKKTIKNIIVIGHGTAAVAGEAVADAMAHYLKDSGLNISARLASELSGFFLKDDLSDTLVIPITQSGTTTDTNRAVAMAKDRGASVITIVNRRQSDITAKSDGVFYTSDGRDIEMSVASTKAFYSQIAAGQILALYIVQLLKSRSDDYIAVQLKNLESAPQLMDRIFSGREAISKSVEKTFDRKFWAVVGSGPNKAAADEIRIKLSELCYKTISSDIVENKKHIDLSAEPLILVCAAGSPASVMEDLVKEVEIFKAHKAAVVVFAEEDDSRFDDIADAVIYIPAAAMPLPVILNTMAGHLWGYYAACNINHEALLLKEFRSSLERAIVEQEKKNYSLHEKLADAALRQMIGRFDKTFNRHREAGAFHLLSVKTISDLIILLKYAAGKLPLEDFRSEFQTDNGFISPLEVLDGVLGKAIDELTRPIDAIRHQAKTVTVGTTRKEKIFRGILFETLERLHFSTRDLTYKNLMTLSRIQPAVMNVSGLTLYKIENLDAFGNPAEDSTIDIIQREGVSAHMRSRTETSKQLMGTKRMIVSMGHVYVGKGKIDGAPIVIIPLKAGSEFINRLLLLHIDYQETLPLSEKKKALGYRYNDIRNLVNEYNIAWDDGYLEKFSVADLFGEPVEILAARIRQWAKPGN